MSYEKDIDKKERKISMKKAFTHSGRFHADDVFSAALLTYLYPDIIIERGFEVPENYGGIVFDIGFGKYDHHQEQKAVRENQVPYAAFGLLWKEYGEQILGKEQAEKFDESFVQPLDFSDNTGEKNELAEMIALFNPSWDENKDADQCFQQAKEVALQILERKFTYMKGEVRAEQIITDAMEQAENHILVLEQFVPWKKKLIGTDIYFVVFPSQRGGYCAQGVPVEKDSTEIKYSFLEDWRGKTKEELQKISGLDTLTFCHNSGFLIAADTVEDAMKACRMSMED